MTPSGKYGSRLLAPYQRFQSAKIQKFRYTNTKLRKNVVFLQREFNNQTIGDERIPGT